MAEWRKGGKEGGVVGGRGRTKGGREAGAGLKESDDLVIGSP